MISMLWCVTTGSNLALLSLPAGPPVPFPIIYTFKEKPCFKGNFYLELYSVVNEEKVIFTWGKCFVFKVGSHTDLIHSKARSAACHIPHRACQTCLGYYIMYTYCSYIIRSDCGSGFTIAFHLSQYRARKFGSELLLQSFRPSPVFRKLALCTAPAQLSESY